MKKQLLNIALLLTTAGSIKAQVSFAPAVYYGTDANPEAVFSTDFNGDGKMDLATSSFNTYNVSVLLGSGTGTFSAAVNSGVGLNLISIYSADFNSDGKKDLVTANLASNSISVVFGSGTGAFGAAVNYNVGVTPYSVFSADFNGDGNMDLVTANRGGNNVSVLLGSATGTFAASVNYAVGTYPYSVFSADFNGDGNKDLVTANSQGNNVSVLLGSGTGTFAPAVNYGAGTNPTSVFSADFNNDGKMDLATANGGSNNVSVLLGSGTGTFAAAVNYGVGNIPRSVFSTDFNNDGKMDLATANVGSYNVSVLLGSGTGTFATAVNYYAGNNATSVFSADFNGDGKMDLTTANRGSSNVSVLLNTTTAAALNFDGTNDFVNIPNNSSFNFGTNDFTIETYAKTSSVAGNRVMIGKIFGANNFWFGVSNGKANFSLTGGPDALGTSTIGDGNWHHIAAVRQSGVVSLYVDGVLEATQNNTGNATINSNLTLGNFNGGFNFPGSLDEVRIWSRALCKGEILNNKNAELLSSQTGLVAYYKFNQGLPAANNTIISLTDLSGNANNGTLNNFALTGAASNWVAPGAVTSGSTAPTYTPVSASVSSQVNVLCNGSNTGSVTVTATGGTSPYTYLASTGATVSTLSNLTAGAYTYTVTDANTCQAIQTLTITQPTALITNTSVTHILCNGSNTGSAIISASGGSSGYTYLWSGGQTTALITGQNAGVKTVTVTDANGCTKIQSATITEPTAINTSTTITNVLCNGGSTGAINLTVSGGVSGYTFMWNDGITTEDRINIPAGVKTVTVTDANSCTKIQSATITEPTVISLYVVTNSPTVCSGSTSTLTANATGGTGTITYSWVAGPTASISVVSPTSTTVYTVNVTDANNCAATATVNITVNTLPNVTVNSGAICTGQSFTMIPSGADTYTYSNGSDVAMPTTDATYTVSGIEASTGCSNTAVSSVTVNPLPVIVSNPGNVHTCGDVSATFGVSSAGTNTYQWYFEYTQLPNDSGLIDGSYTEINFNTDTMTIQQVLTGNYNNYYVYCEVTNQYGCKAYGANDTIWANPSPTVSVNSGTICAGQSFTMIPGGANTYSYSNGSNIAMPTVDATYTVTGTDANGCKNTAVSTVSVNALPVLMATTSNTLLCTGQTATLSVMGANTYTWSTTETTTDIMVTPTVQTTYTVDGTDANGCSNTTTITQDVSLCTGIASLTNDTSVNVYPNPNNGSFVVELTSLSKVTITNALGQVIISETYDAGKHTVNINNEASGVYFVKVMTNNRQQIIKVIKE